MPLANIFRTDLGDDESDGDGPTVHRQEGDHGQVANQTDPAGDDDVDILIRPSGEVVVEYRNP